MSQRSIILPVYKVEQYFFSRIKSILDQTIKDFEFILVDGASSDKGPEIYKGSYVFL